MKCWGMKQRLPYGKKKTLLVKNICMICSKMSGWIYGGALILASCGQVQQATPVVDSSVAAVKAKAVSCESNLPSRFSVKEDPAHPGMVWIAGGTFRMGGDNGQAQADEYPKHTV